MTTLPLIKKTSHLRFANFLTDLDGDQEGFDFYDLIDLPEIVPQNDDIKHEVLTTDRIDLLANTYYGDPILKWAIAVRNNLELLPGDLAEGTEIIIPSPRYVRNELFKKKIKKD